MWGSLSFAAGAIFRNQWRRHLLQRKGRWGSLIQLPRRVMGGDLFICLVCGVVADVLSNKRHQFSREESDKPHG